ncbi:MAG: TonB-dependent receptor [Psychrilyobacter sp.]|nr:TonB-dependent receptor [Psychrilyobacter sp.]
MKKRVGALALILTCSIYANALSTDGEDQFFEDAGMVRLGETTISGDGFESTIRHTPKNITIITAKDIEESGAKNVVEAVKSVPGVKVGSGMNNSGVIDIRGQGANFNRNTAIIVDGVKMNAIDMSSFNLYSIPIETIEKIEVIPSGAAVVYGDNTVGGAINITTKKGSAKDGLTLQSEAGSYNQLNSSVGFTTTKGKFKTFGNATRKNSDGYRDNSFVKSDDVVVGTKYQINESNAVILKYDYHDDHMGFPGSLNEAQIKDDRKQTTSPDDWGKNRSHRLNLGYVYKKDNLEIINNTNTYRSNYTSEMTYGYPGPPSNMDTKTTNGSNDFKIKYNTENNKIIAGIDILEGKTNNQGVWAKKQSVGGFISDTYSITESLDLTGGLRQQYTKFSYSASGDDKKYNTTVYDIALNYKYSETGSTFISYGTDFRTPTTDELLASNGYLNTDLKPQTGNNTEIGIKDYIGKTFISGAVFHKIIKNEIYYDKTNPAGGWGTNSNYDENNKKIGFELLAERKFMKKLTLTGSYSYLQSEIDGGVDKGNKTPGVSENKFALGAKYDFTEKLKSNILFNYVGSSFAYGDISNNYDKIDSYTTLDLGVSYQINPSFNLYGGIKNLTDEKYHEYVGNSSGTAFYYPAAERSYYIGFRYTM